jgi:hypothetical protein
MRTKPLDREVRFAGIGRPKDSRDRRALHRAEMDCSGLTGKGRADPEQDLLSVSTLGSNGQATLHEPYEEHIKFKWPL